MVDWNLASHKLVKSILAVIIAGLAEIYGHNQYYLALAPILLYIENVASHWADEPVVTVPVSTIPTPPAQ